MTKRILTGCAIAGAICSLAIAQAVHIKAGLWESTANMNMGGNPMASIPEDRLAKMPPEQRAQVEAMLKGAMAPTTTKLCYTREQLDKGFNYAPDRAGACQSKIVSATDSKHVSEITCDSGRGKTTGTVTIETVDQEHFTGNVLMHTAVNGQVRDMTVKLSGKWVSADCGDVKPRDYSK